MGRRLRLVLACLAIMLAAGCRLEITVGVDVAGDGSGRVQAVAALDAQAAERFPDLARQLRVDDLTQAGWNVTGPTVEGDGRTYVRLTRPFATPEEAGEILDELSGDDGPFRDLKVERSSSFAATDFDLTGTVDLSAGPEGFGDDALRDHLGGTSLGWRPEEIESQAGAPLSEIFGFRVVADLPGGVNDTNAPRTVDGAAVWRPSLGERIEMEAASRSWHLSRLLWTLVAVLAGAGAIAAGLRAWAPHRRGYSVTERGTNGR